MSRVIKSSQVNIVERVIKDLEKENIDVNISEENIENSNTEDEYEKILDIARKQAEDIVNDAVKEAGGIKEGVIKDAEEELEKIKKQSYDDGYNSGLEQGQLEGYDKGHAEGLEKGYNEGKDQSQSLIEEANDIKRKYLNEKEEVLNSIEKDVIELVVDIVKKILNQKIEENDETIINLILRGLESLNSKDDIRIRVSKKDFEKVNESKEEILSKVSLIENLKVDMDSNLEKGDCIIESSKGNVDVSLDTQIKNVEQELKELLDSE